MRMLSALKSPLMKSVILVSSLIMLAGCATTMKRQPTKTVVRQTPVCSIHLRDLSTAWSHAAYSCPTAAAPVTPRVRNLVTPSPVPEAKLAGVNDVP